MKMIFTVTRYNRVDTKFWKNGHGKGFKTINSTHAQSGTTTERAGYYAQHLAAVF